MARRSAPQPPHPAATGSGGGVTAPVAAPRLRQLVAPFSHRHIFLEWNVEAKAAFPAGTRLYTLRHAGDDALPLFTETLLFGLSLGAVRLAGVGRKHSEVSPEAGILVWQVPGGWQSVTAGEQLGSWVSLHEWQAFAALLERHERRIRSERAAGRGGSEAAASAAAETVRAELAAGQAQLASLLQQRRALAEELAATENAVAVSVPHIPSPAAGESAAESGNEALFELLEGIGHSRPEALAAYARAGGAATLAELERALAAVAGCGAPLPVDDLLLIRAHASIVADFAANLAAFDELLAATLADPHLEESEREERLHNWCSLRAQLLDQV